MIGTSDMVRVKSEDEMDENRLMFIACIDHQDALAILEQYCEDHFVMDTRTIDIFPCKNCSHTYLAHYGKPASSCIICAHGELGTSKEGCTGYKKKTPPIIIEGEVLSDRKELL